MREAATQTCERSRCTAEGASAGCAGACDSSISARDAVGVMQG